MSISAESWQLSLRLLVTRPGTLFLPAIESFNAWKFRVHKYKTEGKLICSKPGPDWLLNTKMLGKDIVSVLPGDSFSVSSFILRMIGFFYRCGKRMFQATGADRGGAVDNQLRIPSSPLSILLLFFLIVDLMFAILGQTVCRIFLFVCVFLNNKTLFKPVTSVLSCSTETFLCTIKYIYYNFPLISEIWNKAIYIGIWGVVS